MKEKIAFFGLLAGLFATVVFSVSCNQTNHGTIQVLDNQSQAYTGGCTLNVNLDGGGNHQINQTSYTFQNVSGGNHTLNFSLSDSGSCSGCTFQATGKTGYSCNFNVTNGILYTASAFNTGNCASVSILCP